MNTHGNVVLTRAYTILCKAVYLQYFISSIFHWLVILLLSLKQGCDSFTSHNNGDCIVSFSSWCAFTVSPHCPVSPREPPFTESQWRVSNLIVLQPFSQKGGCILVLRNEWRSFCCCSSKKKGPRLRSQYVMAASCSHINFIYWFWYKEVAPLSVVLNLIFWSETKLIETV